MLNNQDNIEFLCKLSNVVSKKISPVNSINAINKLLKTYLNINKAEIIIWDSNSMLLKDFGDDLKLYEETESGNEILF